MGDEAYLNPALNGRAFIDGVGEYMIIPTKQEGDSVWYNLYSLFDGEVAFLRINLLRNFLEEFKILATPRDLSRVPERSPLHKKLEELELVHSEDYYSKPQYI